MYAQTSQKIPQTSIQTTTTPSRATLKTRPRIQRACIRSWEYNRPVRITVLVIRLLVVMWLFVLTDLLVSNGFPWGWAFPPVAAAVLAIALWVFTTAEKGWPVTDA
ncbi:MAG TPA: hypothetical protein VHZ33_31310 [Trebonia sp.]|jgi:hypothetical protein|nr:hypothetical protein [Trebonia sp.]